MKMLALVVLLFACGVVPAIASEYGTREEAVAMVKRVQEKFAKDGAETTFATVSDPSVKEFHDRDLYPFIYNLDGVCVAHGARPVLIGKDLISLKDQQGKYLIQEMIAIAKEKGSGWVSYKWPHPITNKIEDKVSYIGRMDDYFVGVGVRP
jgi:cytochrome c